MEASTLAIPQLNLETSASKARRAALPPANDNLSPRERQVVTLLHTGLTRKEVAYELGLNDATVRVHLWHANRKARRTPTAG
jgi:DNA-binding NarL/FixJ family response regulator